MKLYINEAEFTVRPTREAQQKAEREQIRKKKAVSNQEKTNLEIGRRLDLLTRAQGEEFSTRPKKKPKPEEVEFKVKPKPKTDVEKRDELRIRRGETAELRRKNLQKKAKERREMMRKARGIKEWRELVNSYLGEAKDKDKEMEMKRVKKEKMEKAKKKEMEKAMKDKKEMPKKAKPKTDEIKPKKKKAKGGSKGLIDKWEKLGGGN